MKKILLFTVLFTMTLAGCDKDGGSEQTKSITVELKTSETKSPFNGSDVEIISLDNDFIAEISDEGVVKGMHMGNTRAVVKSGNTTYNCEIKVSPEFTLYIDPVIWLGATKAQVEEVYGTPTRQSGNTYYYEALLLEAANAFTYENGKAVAAVTGYVPSYATQVAKHLACRYTILTTNPSSGDILMGDAYELDDVKTAVLVETSGQGVTIIYATKEYIDSQE